MNQRTDIRHRDHRRAGSNGLRTALASLVFSTAAALAITGCGSEQPDTAASDAAESELKIVALGGSVTETVYALGFGENVIAVDVSSTYPAEATKLPQVGYQRTLSAENILAMGPTLIIGSTETGPPAAIEQLRSSGVKVVIVPGEPTREGIHGKISGVADALGVPEKGAALIDSLESTLANARQETLSTSPRVLFMYARSAGSIHVSGTNTAADLMIDLAGATNAVDAYEGFRPLTAEGVVAAAPDIILLPSGGLETAGGPDGLLQVPGVAETPAGRNRRIVSMDDLYLLGLGPRTGQAVADLASLLRKAMNENESATSADAKRTTRAVRGGV